MKQLNLPPYEVNVKQMDGRLVIFDILRKKHVALTPEEWVRQHFINYLIVEKSYPRNLMENERLVNLNNQKKRCDSVIYNRSLEPIMIIEYKAPEVNITQTVFNQIANYNIVLKVDYLIVSNGLSHYCCKLDYENQTFSYLEDIPSYEEILEA